MTKYIISDKALDAITSERGRLTRTLIALAARFDVTMDTPRNWISKKNIILTTPDAVEVISEHTGLLSSEIITFSPVQQTA